MVGGGQIGSWPETVFVPPKFTVETSLTQVLAVRPSKISESRLYLWYSNFLNVEPSWLSCKALTVIARDKR
jgi:hypothetical protein